MIVAAEDIEQTYQNAGRSLTVLKNIDISVDEKDFVAIVGPSGSGKTTLLGLLAGLDSPTRGRIFLDGSDISKMTEDQRALLRARSVGFVFQSFQLMPTLTAFENVIVPIELAPGRHDRDATSERARELLERVGLGDRLDHYPTQLSGGEQQRVALARAFANEPRILFADEPTGNLDSENGNQIARLLTELNRERGTTLIMVTHDLKLAELAGRIIRLEGGEVVEDRATVNA